MRTSNRPDSGKVAVIGGSGLYSLGLGALNAIHKVQTPYAEEPVSVEEEKLGDARVLFLPRHGAEHRIAPHRINYRANIRALATLGVDRIIAINAVGGISPGLTAGRLVIPEQIIDYSYGREHTFFNGDQGLDQHVDFSHPYDGALSQLLAAAAKKAKAEFRLGGVYGCTQGPRLETVAEIRRMQRDGCDMVGMTGMPEAALARELGLRYASLALVVNRAAGLGVDATITADSIKSVLEQGIATVRLVLEFALNDLFG
jgi:5'-methylthioinosine phosphorylase